jgi:plasmid stability protein
MADFVVRNIPEESYKRLQDSAKEHGRSLNAEFLDILNDRDFWALRRMQIRSTIPKLRRFRKKVAKKFPAKYEMRELIREERERR